MKVGDSIEFEGWKYEAVKELGIGSFGAICKCRCSEMDSIQGQLVVALALFKGKYVAIKEVSNLDERYGVDSYLIREVSSLMAMDHPNIVKLLNVHTSGTSAYIVFECLDNNLQEFIYKSRRIVEHPVLRKKLLQQILRGVAYCHSQNILHRDLNPKNVLIDTSKEIVKLADFGLAKTMGVPAETYTAPVGSSFFYKAPELLLGSCKYSTPIDIWSVGCIFSEMVHQVLIFYESDAIAQLRRIFSILGTPNETTWPGYASLYKNLRYLPGYTSLYHSIPFFPDFFPQDLAQEFNGLEEDGVHLLSRMLCLDPSKRISAHDALQHPYFENV